MVLSELLEVDITENLTNEIVKMDWDVSLEELHTIKDWFFKTKENADRLTLEDEIVGYTYDNLTSLSSRINDVEITAEINKIYVKK